MSKNANKIISFLLSALISVSSVLPAFATEIAEETAETTEITVINEPQEPSYGYRIEGLGKVTAATVKNVGMSAKYYNFLTDENGVKQSAHVVLGDALRGAVLRGVNVGDTFGKRGKISALKNDAESENRLLAAVNGDFFSMQTGVPMSIFVSDGRYISSSDGLFGVGVNADGSAVFGKVGDSVQLVLGEKTLEIHHFNKFPTVYGVYLLTRDFGDKTRLESTITATEYIIAYEGDITLGSSIRGTVKEIRTQTGSAEIPEGCMVLVVPDLYAYSADYRDIGVDDTVEIKIAVNEEFSGVVSVLGGGDIILRDGEITDTLEDDAIETARNPRTAVGITESGEFMLMVVDGRKSGYSVGVKLTALAEAMRDMGCTDAINLDGGGSSVMVLFGGGGIVNRPSDNAERSVPNAAVLYENREVADVLHTLSLTSAESLIFTGASIPLSLTLKNSLGEVIEVGFNEENTHFTVDELFGKVGFCDGVPTFTAGGFDGVGKVTATVLLEGETVTADLFLEVTATVDTLTLDQNIIIANQGEIKPLEISAKLGGRDVFFGDTVALEINDGDIEFSLSGRTVSLWLRGTDTVETDAGTPSGIIMDESAETLDNNGENAPLDENLSTSDEVTFSTGENTETDVEYPTYAYGILGVTLGDKFEEVFVLFDDELVLNIGKFILPSVTVLNEGYTLTFDENGGVTGEGAFIIESPVVPEETAAETAEETTAETAEVIVEAAEDSNISEETAGTTVPTETTLFEETSEPEETAENTEISEIDEFAETTEPEPAFEPFEVVLKAENALVSDGLYDRNMWIWAEGLAPSVTPYATVKTADGEKIIHYDRFYDFLDYNGRALFTLSFEGIEGIVALDTLFAFTADKEEQKITLGAPVISKTLDTNLYADTAEHWSSYYVNSLSYMGIVNGSENLHGELVYTPDGNLTREQFAKILVNFLKIDIAEYENTELDFADNGEIAAWAVPFVRAAVGAGLMRGRSTPADTVIFAPADKITRQEAIYVLGGLLTDGEIRALDFTDGDRVAPWAAENLSKALAAGLISGYGDGSLRPEGSITRAEAATVVVRLYEFMSENREVLEKTSEE